MRGNPGYLVVGFLVGFVMTIFNLIGFIWGIGDIGYFLLAGIMILMGLSLYAVSYVFDKQGDALKGVGE